MKIIGAAELESKTCSECREPHECGPLSLLPVCHRNAAVWATYMRGERTLILRCTVCDQIVVAVAVGEPLPEFHPSRMTPELSPGE